MNTNARPRIALTLTPAEKRKRERPKDLETNSGKREGQNGIADMDGGNTISPEQKSVERTR